MLELESLFFVYTKHRDVADWQPFRQYDPADVATFNEIRSRINQRIDRELKDRVPEERRFYFRHSSHGLYLMPDDEKPSWADVKGIVAELSTTPSDRATTNKLVKAITELAESALPYARVRTRILACFVPANADLPPLVLDYEIIRVRRPEGSRQLEEAITAWLVDVSFDAMRDRTGASAELKKLADEYVESCMLRRAKTGRSG